MYSLALFVSSFYFLFVESLIVLLACWEVPGFLHGFLQGWVPAWLSVGLGSCMAFCRAQGALGWCQSARGRGRFIALLPVHGTPLQYSCLENPMDGGAWWAAVHGVAKSRTRLSGFTFTFHFHALEKAMATHSSALAWRIPGMAEPGGMPSIGSHRVGHD